MGKVGASKFTHPQAGIGYLFSATKDLPEADSVPVDGVVINPPGYVIAPVLPRLVNRLWGTEITPKQLPESVLFVVAGGNAPGQNAFLKSAMQQLIENGVKVMVAWGGIKTLLEESPHITEINREHLDQVDILSGSVFIGTSRAPQTKKDPALIDKIAAAIKATGAEKVVVIGGDGTLKLAEELSERGISLIGAPKTMDGNLAIKLSGHLERVYSLGFLSAVEKAAKYARLLDAWGKQEKQIVFMELNGRDTGWITYETARKTGLPCFILEQKVSFADLYNKVKEMQETGGVLLVSESLEIIEKNGKTLDLQTLAGDPVRKDASDVIQHYLSEHGASIRNINLTPLIEASLSTDSHVVEQYLKEMVDSAASQGRINVVSVDAKYFNQLGALPPNIYIVTNEQTLEELNERLGERSQKTDVILVASDHHFEGANQHWELAKTDETGRVHYASRNLSGYLSAFINSVLNIKTTHFVATHLLMASGTDKGDAFQADLMAQAVVQGLINGVDGKIVSFVEGHPTALLLPLDELQNYQIPLEVTQADNNRGYVTNLMTLFSFLRDTPHSIFNADSQNPAPMIFQLDQNFNDLLDHIHSLPRRGDFIAFARDLVLAKLEDFVQLLFSHFYAEQKKVVDSLKHTKEVNGQVKGDEFLAAIKPLLVSYENINNWWELVKEVLNGFMSSPQAQSIGGKYHDFKNRMNPLVGYSSLAEEGIFDDADITNGTFDPPTDIRQLISNLARDPKNMQMGAEIYEIQVRSLTPVPILAPAILEQLKSVLMEFVNNGVKYARVGQKPSVSVQATHDEHFLRLIVADNGIGMSPEFIEKRYGKSGEREKRIADPTGFLNEGWGVADAIKRVQALGGSVKAESVVDEGSTITVEIPLESLRQDSLVNDDDALSAFDDSSLEATWQELEQNADALARVPVIPSPYLSSPVSWGPSIPSAHLLH